MGISTAAAGALGAALDGRSDHGGDDGEQRPPPRLGEVLYDRRSGGLQVQIRVWHRAGVRQGRVFLAVADRFEVVPSPHIQSTLAFAAPALGDFAAINGGFYDDNEQPMGLVRHAGRTVHGRTRHGGSGFLVQTAGGARLLPASSLVPVDSTEGLQSIDRLVVDGRVVVGAGASPAPDARSAVFIDAHARVSLMALVADAAEVQASSSSPEDPTFWTSVRLGRRSSDTGCSLAECAALLALSTDRGGLGARQALNLDGGYSTSFQARVGTDTIRVDPHRATINALRLGGRPA